MPVLEAEEIDRRLTALPGWSLEGQAIAREFDCGDFDGSVAFAVRIAPIADEAGHHPDLAISWATVKVSLTTHSEGGLTEADFALAGRIDEVAAS